MSDAAAPRHVICCLFPSALPLAEKAAAALDARIDLKGRDFASTPAHLRSLFLAGHPIVALAAAGIVIRALAPVLGDKRDDPPVVALAEDGSSALPLLGGHHGANAMARRLGEALNAHPAITTAGDLRLGVALDAPPRGWVLENPQDARPVMTALIDGAQARLSGEAPWLAPLKAERRMAAPGDPVVLSVDGTPPLVYRRRAYALGLGAARGCDPDEMLGLVRRSLAEQGLAESEIASVHSIDLKADEAAIHHVARSLDVPARFHAASALEAQTPRLANPSTVVFSEVGTHGVAEAAALLAAGPQAVLCMEKVKSANATCALAELGPGGQEGRARGSLAVVGIGPGAADWRSPEASRLIAEADELVGYGLYLDLLGPAARHKARHEFALGEEEARCRYALERAGTGRRVALICSGDGGIYAMGSLVMELLSRPENAGGVSAAARAVELHHAPGISALQAASARAGALLGHDFCTISLSDLLTRRSVILKRIEASAKGDFVIAFYNPVSRKRRTLLAEARDLLLRHRPAETPVLLASNLGRPTEKLTARSLATLSVDDVDMLTLVLVGASTSRAWRAGDISAGAEGTWMFTPRGYDRKIDGDLA